jgi:3-deoxy-D-manno-octulosonic-acid transferase
MVFGEEEFMYLQKKLLLIIEFVSWCCCSTDVDLAAVRFKFQNCASCSIKYSKKCAYKLQTLGNPRISVHANLKTYFSLTPSVWMNLKEMDAAATTTTTTTSILSTLKEEMHLFGRDPNQHC